MSDQQSLPNHHLPAASEDGFPTTIEQYRALFTLSDAGIYRVEYVPPIDTHLSVDEQIALARQHNQVAECNDALARQFGYERASDLLDRLKQLPPARNAQAELSNRTFIENGYRLDNVEVTRHHPQGMRTYLISAIGVVEDGFLVRTWNIQRDISEQEQAQARLQEYAARLEAQNRELAVLHAVALAAANATNEDSLIEETTEIIGNTLYPDIFGVLLVDDEVNGLRPHHSYRGIDDIFRHQLVAPSQGITGHVMSTGQVLRVNDVSQESRYVPLYDHIQSEMAVPIKVGSRVIGLINVESNQMNAFTEADERLLTICAGQLATAIERLRALAKEQSRQAWLEKVIELGKTVTQITDWDECVHNIHRVIRQELSFDRVGLFRYEPVDHSVRGILGTNLAGEPEDTSFFASPVTEDAAFQQVLAHPKGFVFFENLAEVLPRPIEHEMHGIKNHATVAAWAGETPVAVITVDNGITQRTMTEAQLEALRLFAGYAGLALANAGLLDQVRQAEANYRSIFENSLEGIFRTAPNGRLISANPALARICGYDSPQEMVALVQDVTVQLYYDPERRQEALELLEQRGEILHFEFRARRKDGTPLWVSIQARAVRDAAGTLLYYEGALQNIDQRKQAEAEREQLELQLRQSQKMEAIGRLTGGIAHDFNNLLTVILSAADLLLRTQDENEESKWLNHIKQAGEKAAALIRQLLAFSRQQLLELTILDLNEVLEHFASMFQRLIGEDIELVLDLKEPVGWVQADETQVEQVVLNLVVNARDAMPDGGKLILQTDNVFLDESYSRHTEGVKPGWYTMLAVSDTGIGMNAETQARIFEPFFTTKEMGKGTGLGLATVYGIVRQFEGHIAVYSEPGMGATFKVYLPHAAASAAATPSSSYTASETLLGDETILLVEDNEIVRELAQAVLTGAGYQVLAAGGQEALAFLPEVEEPIDLLLTDVVMPKISGRELAQQWLSARPQLKILYMSGYADALIRHHGLLQANVAFLPKPFTPDTLLRKVRDVLDR